MTANVAREEVMPMFSGRELSTIARLLAMEVRKQERRPGHMTAEGYDVQAYKVKRLKTLLDKVRRLEIDATEPTDR